MGPGLFFAFFLLLAAGRSRAETAVGLDARGVNPIAAVNNPDGLDVRDALGRPVTAQAVLADMNKASAARAAQNSYSSHLPKAKAVLPMMEGAVDRCFSLVRWTVTQAASAVLASLPTPRPKAALPFLALLGTVLILTASASRPRALMPALSSCRRCLEVLRC
ncbi:MAG: hypothetical protein ACHQ49_07430 [Elusimicrobiota bacterium]